ncbi:MAG: 50S ribosomal protein L6 [Pseudomonadota bacterium]|nr:50S ribosomal protein L6 [Pseudomonadota bacterium]
MSRIGKAVIEIPEGVKAKVSDSRIVISGPKGELDTPIFIGTKVKLEENLISIYLEKGKEVGLSKWGLQRSLIYNSVIGVSEGYSKRLEINGVGYRAQIKGKNLQLSLGFSHDINYEPPEDIKIETSSQTEILVSGIDKQKVGQVAAEIRAFRPPEPYKGKGIKYENEYIFRKEGKKK